VRQDSGLYGGTESSAGKQPVIFKKAVLKESGELSVESL